MNLIFIKFDAGQLTSTIDSASSSSLSSLICCRNLKSVYKYKKMDYTPVSRYLIQRTEKGHHRKKVKLLFVVIDLEKRIVFDDNIYHPLYLLHKNAHV